MNVALRFASAVFVAAALLAPAQAQDAPKKAPPAKRVAGAHSLRTYPVPGGNADAMAKFLQEIFPTPATRWPRRRPSDRCLGRPGDASGNRRAEALQSASVAVIPLWNARAGRPRQGGSKPCWAIPRAAHLFIEADVESDSIRVRGSAEQIDEVRQTILPLDKAVESSGKMRVVTIENGSAATVAEAIHLLFPKIRNNPINVTTAAKKSDPTEHDPKAPQSLNLVAAGNRLVITSDDPEAVAMAASLVRMLVASTGMGDFEVIRLQHAKAVHVAKVLDEAFNGKAGGERRERVRVVADAEANLLLMRARALDAITIRSLIYHSLDAPADKPRGGK